MTDNANFTYRKNPIPYTTRGLPPLPKKSKPKPEPKPKPELITRFAFVENCEQVVKRGNEPPFFELKSANPKEKGTNYANLMQGRIEFMNGQNGYALLEPSKNNNVPPKKETFIAWLKGMGIEQAQQTLKSMDILLEHGYRVLFVYGGLDDLRQAIELHEYSLNLCHAITYSETTKDFDGLNVNIYQGLEPLTDTLERMQALNIPILDRTLDKLVKDYDFVLFNKEWLPLSDIDRKQNQAPDLPLKAFGELAPLIDDIKNNSDWSYGMIITALLGVLGGVLRSHHTTDSTDPDLRGNTKPLGVYTCIGADPNTGKDELTDYLMHPIVLHQELVFHDYKEYKKNYPQAIEPEPQKTFTSYVGSVKGLLKHLAKNESVTISNTEARAFFSSFGGADQAQQSLGILNSFWVGKTQDYLTKDEQVYFKPQTRLSLYLMTQNDDFGKQVNNTEFWDSGFLNRFLLHSESPPDYNNLKPITLDYNSTVFNGYTHKVALLLNDNINTHIVLPAECNTYLGKLSIAYKSRMGDQYPHHRFYQNKSVGGFIGRAYEHIIKIASILLAYEKVKGNLKPTQFNSLVWRVEFSDDKKECWITDEPLDNPNKGKTFTRRQTLFLTIEYIERAEKIFEFYVQNLIVIMSEHTTDKRLEKLMNKIYELTAGGQAPTFSELKRVRPLRDTKGGTGSAPVAEYWEVIDMLKDLGYIKLQNTATKSRSTNSIIRLHPDYRPRK